MMIDDIDFTKKNCEKYRKLHMSLYRMKYVWSDNSPIDMICILWLWVWDEDNVTTLVLL